MNVSSLVKSKYVDDSSVAWIDFRILTCSLAECLDDRQSAIVNFS